MLLEWLIQFGPITLFFVVFELTHKNFFSATIVLMVATAFAVMAELRGRKKVALFPLLSAGFIVFFGGATLFFQNPQFLIIKDTVYDSIFGLALIFSLSYRRNLMKMLFDSLFAMNDRGWRILSERWAYFFLCSAFLNELVRHMVAPHVWVHYKMIHTATLVIFGMYQLTLTRRERLPEFTNSLGMRIRKHSL